VSVFYYPARPSQEADDFLQTLRGEVGFIDLPAIPGGCRLNDTLCLQLRSGDIIILFAKNSSELDELLELGDEFEDFIIILVMPGDDARKCRDRALLLSPRFMAAPGDYKELVQVLERIVLRNEQLQPAT